MLKNHFVLTVIPTIQEPSQAVLTHSVKLRVYNLQASIIQTNTLQNSPHHKASQSHLCLFIVVLIALLAPSLAQPCLQFDPVLSRCLQCPAGTRLVRFNCLVNINGCIKYQNDEFTCSKCDRGYRLTVENVCIKENPRAPSYFQVNYQPSETIIPACVVLHKGLLAENLLPRLESIPITKCIERTYKNQSTSFIYFLQNDNVTIKVTAIQLVETIDQIIFLGAESINSLQMTRYLAEAETQTAPIASTKMVCGFNEVSLVVSQGDFRPNSSLQLEGSVKLKVKIGDKEVYIGKEGTENYKEPSPNEAQKGSDSKSIRNNINSNKPKEGSQPSKAFPATNYSSQKDTDPKNKKNIVLPETSQEMFTLSLRDYQRKSLTECLAKLETTSFPKLYSIRSVRSNLLDTPDIGNNLKTAANSSRQYLKIQLIMKSATYDLGCIFNWTQKKTNLVSFQKL